MTSSTAFRYRDFEAAKDPSMSETFIHPTPHGDVTLEFDDDEQVTILSPTGMKVGELTHREVDEDQPLVRLITHIFLEGDGGRYQSAGVMERALVELQAYGYRMLCRPHDGICRDDGSHLTQDAPGFFAHMESKKLVGRYEW